MTAAEKATALAYWQRHNIAPGTKPHACLFCGHNYLRPCEADEHAACQNFQAAQRRPRPKEAS